jgi:hypothetical protein
MCAELDILCNSKHLLERPQSITASCNMAVQVWCYLSAVGGPALHQVPHCQAAHGGVAVPPSFCK